MKSLNSFINKYIYLKTIDSTNQFLSDYISKNKPQSKICTYSYNQTQGRGQIGRNWFSDEEINLSLSYLLPFSNLLVKDQFKLNMAVSLGLLSLVKSLVRDANVTIKWPNDIYVNDNKIAGILIQNQLKGDKIKYAIVGIGLNVNQETFPGHVPNPISLLQLTKKQYKLPQIVLQLTQHIEKYVSDFNQPFNTLINQYTNCLYRKLEPKQYEDKTGLFTGKLTGVNQQGKLMIEINGILKYYNFHEIRFII